MAFEHRRFLRTYAAFVFALAVAPAFAHQVIASEPVFSSSTPVVATGTVAELVVKTLGGSQLRYFGMKVDRGGSYALNGAGLDSLSNGMRIQATGVVTGNVFQIYFFGVEPQTGSSTAVRSKAVTQKSVTGILAMYHKDFFDEGRGEFGLAVRDASDAITFLNVATIPDSLEIGMLVTADGTPAADASTLDVEMISVLAAAPVKTAPVAESVTTNSVLVIPIRFSTGNAGTANGAAVSTEFQTKVAPYYAEVSYGQQLLNVTVACTTTVLPGCAGQTDANGWLVSTSPVPPPTAQGCDFTTMGALADAAAQAAGYDVSVTATKFIYYLIPNVGCSWAGLAYVGWGHAWSHDANALWVYGHELGHNFGLWHAGSVGCGGISLGGSCGVSEYGDPFDIMGNIRQMHFNAMQKLRLGWIPATSVKAHTTGTQTYQLSPIETGGQSTYAVSIQASATRKYWLEYRQPIGFDAPIASLPNLGAQVRVSGPPFEYTSGSDDTEVVDMTPGSSSGNSSFDDAALLVGQTYTDAANSVSVHVNSATATGLNLTVTTLGANPPATLASAVSRKVHGAAGTFDMPLTLSPLTNPSTEPRLGPSQTLVFTFNKAVTSATATVTEGTATAAAPTFSGNDVIVNLTGVSNHQYVTVALTNVAASDGTTGGSGTVRVGFLLGDVNQSRAVTVADLGLISAVLAQPVSSANFLKDINVSGTLSIADVGMANGNLATALPAP